MTHIYYLTLLTLTPVASVSLVTGTFSFRGVNGAAALGIRGTRVIQDAMINICKMDVMTM